MNGIGLRVSPQRATATFGALRKKAGIRPGRLHDLRHTHASHLLNAGVPIGQVTARLGHSSSVITLSIYSHVMPGSDKDAVEALAEALR
jgi:integrase